MEVTTTALQIIHSTPLLPLLRPSHTQSCFPIVRTCISQFPTSLFNKSFTCFAAADGRTSSAKVGVSGRSLVVKKKAADVFSLLKGTSIFLVGMNSSIKTCLGKLLAETLRYYYFDRCLIYYGKMRQRCSSPHISPKSITLSSSACSDNLVEEAAGGKSALKSFKETDEQGFGESETEVLRQLSSMGRLVVCAGNGAVQSSTNLALLRHGVSLWIDVPLDMVASGMMEEDQIEHAQVMTQLGSLYKELRDGYATADATVSLQNVACQLGYDDLNDVTPEDMTLEVLKEIERLARVKKMMEEAATPF